MFVAGDQLLKGAALNAVQIAELLPQRVMASVERIVPTFWLSRCEETVGTAQMRLAHPTISAAARVMAACVIDGIDVFICSGIIPCTIKHGEE